MSLSSRLSHANRKHEIDETLSSYLLTRSLMQQFDEEKNIYHHDNDDAGMNGKFPGSLVAPKFHNNIQAPASTTASTCASRQQLIEQNNNFECEFHEREKRRRKTEVCALLLLLLLRHLAVTHSNWSVLCVCGG
jgi:hypothetical protein